MVAPATADCCYFFSSSTEAIGTASPSWIDLPRYNRLAPLVNALHLILPWVGEIKSKYYVIAKLQRITRHVRANESNVVIGRTGNASGDGPPP